MGRRRTPIEKYRQAICSPTCPLRPSARLVALTLSDFMSFKTLGGAYPGPARLAANTGYSERTVKYALAEIVKHGYAVKEEIGGSFDEGRFATSYCGTHPCKECNRPVHITTGTRANNDRDPCNSCTPPVPGTGSQEPGPGTRRRSVAAKGGRRSRVEQQKHVGQFTETSVGDFQTIRAKGQQ